MEAELAGLRLRANEMYDKFPRTKRDDLRRLIIDNVESPFRSKPDDSYSGIVFVLALSNEDTPLANWSLSQIVESLREPSSNSGSGPPLTPVKKIGLYNLLLSGMSQLHPAPVTSAAATRKRKNRASRRVSRLNKRKNNSRRNRRH